MNLSLCFCFADARIFVVGKLYSKKPSSLNDVLFSFGCAEKLIKDPSLTFSLLPGTYPEV